MWQSKATKVGKRVNKVSPKSLKTLFFIKQNLSSQIINDLRNLINLLTN